MSFLTWADLSESALLDILMLRDKKPNAPKTCREALARAVGLVPPPGSPSKRSAAPPSTTEEVESSEESSPEGGAAELRVEIELDLLEDAIEVCQAMQFDLAKMSTFFSIVKQLHTRAVRERLPVDVAFTLAKDLLLSHAVHRPPYSIAVFSLKDTQNLSAWLLEHYFRHYKLFHYAFVPRIKVRRRRLSC